MKYQIECNSLNKHQTCLVCNQQFQMREVRLIVCNDQGDSYGEVCPDCTAKGGHWIDNQLEQRLAIS